MRIGKGCDALTKEYVETYYSGVAKHTKYIKQILDEEREKGIVNNDSGIFVVSFFIVSFFHLHCFVLLSSLLLSSFFILNKQTRSFHHNQQVDGSLLLQTIGGENKNKEAVF